MKTMLPLLGFLVCIAWGCKPEPQSFTFHVTTTQWAVPNEPEVGATVILEEQRLQNGVLNAFFTEVERATTPASGNVTLSTLRSNVLSIRIRVEQQGCFDEVVEFNPESLTTGETANVVDVAVMPECQVTAQLTHDGTPCPSGDVIYRWIPRDVLGAQSETKWTCETGWQNLSPGQSSTEYCWISGGTWLLHQRYWSCVDSTHLDSVWCPAGEAITLTLD